MKKISSLLLVLIIVLGLTSCGGNSSESTATKNNNKFDKYVGLYTTVASLNENERYSDQRRTLDYWKIKEVVILKDDGTFLHGILSDFWWNWNDFYEKYTGNGNSLKTKDGKWQGDVVFALEVLIEKPKNSNTWASVDVGNYEVVDATTIELNGKKTRNMNINDGWYRQTNESDILKKAMNEYKEYKNKSK